MITSGVELNANYGSPNAPAACVSGTECCDIDGFEASLTENNGNYSVNINGGAVPIQEVEISMIDYHVEYSNEDCKPDDLGNFGTLSSSTTTLANLLLNASDNNTSSLTWLPGSPSVLNGSVNLDIIDPLTLNLDCCEVTFSFCLKVRVKDVNCNVCEKIICFSSDQLTEPDPCNIDIKDLGQDKAYCPGDSITLNWSGTTPSGLVDIGLFDNTNSVMYQVLATGISNTGTYTYSIPSNIPCDPARTWSFVIQDSEKLCSDRSTTFTIECCQQTPDCDCGDWKTDFIGIKGFIKEIPKDPKLKIYTQPYLGKQLKCGDEIKLKKGAYYSFTAPTYICNPKNCDVTYKWEVEDSNGVIQSGFGKTFNYNFSVANTYTVTFTPICGGKRCAPCKITVIIENLIQHDPDPIGIPYELPSGTGDITNPKTGKTWMNKNLGATHVATSSTDSLAYGDLYQWGRLTDGHEKRTSSTTTTLSSTDIPGHNNFIINNTSYSDWRTPKNNNLWQGVNGVNNPCPSGYRLPTAAEMEAERLSWTSNDAAGAFASPLKWTVGGARNNLGQLNSVNQMGYYWSSSVVNSSYSYRFLIFDSVNTGIFQNYRIAGFCVRCIKN